MARLASVLVNDPLIDSLARAVAASPDDLTLRLHLAELLVRAGRGEEAIGHLAAVLASDPGEERARGLMAKAMGISAAGPQERDAAGDAPEPAPRRAGGFDWGAAEAELGDIVPPMFVDSDAETTGEPAYEVERPVITLADVGGLTDVKKRLDAAFLAPLRNPKLRALYKKNLKGGLLLYGPPGCGKTFLAKAVAGELSARFMSVSLADVLEMWIGQSERNLRELFELARRSAPCVLFLDEADAIGQKRTQLRNSAMRSTVNQLLSELDGIGSDNEGVFVLAATNAPWDIDAALRRPGRLDRMLLVLPPDAEAREAILRYHLRDRPVAGVDLAAVAKRTDGLTGADLAHLCETAAERALLDSASSGEIRMIEMADLEAARAEVRPSARPWLETARNVALFANDGGEYDELLRYLKKNRLA